MWIKKKRFSDIGFTSKSTIWGKCLKIISSLADVYWKYTSFSHFSNKLSLCTILSVAKKYEIINFIFWFSFLVNYDEKLFQKTFSKEKPNKKKASLKVLAFLLLTEPLKASESTRIANIERKRNLIDTHAVMKVLTRARVRVPVQGRTGVRTLLVQARHLLKVVPFHFPHVNAEKLLIFSIE